MGIALGGAAIGSALGIGAAGQAAAGAWAKEAKAGKPLNFTYIILAGVCPCRKQFMAWCSCSVALKPGIIGDAAVTSTHAGTLLGIGIAGWLG